MTNEEFRDWIDWEGGVVGLIRHGINDETFDDPETERLWKECVRLFEPFEAAKSALSRHINY